MMFLLGRQAMLGHDPPIYLRSITATRCPCPAQVHAALVDPVPPTGLPSRILQPYRFVLKECFGLCSCLVHSPVHWTRYTPFISPPSMRTDVPVIHLAVGETMKPSRSAISSGRP